MDRSDEWKRRRREGESSTVALDVGSADRGAGWACCEFMHRSARCLLCCTAVDVKRECERERTRLAAVDGRVSLHAVEFGGTR
jgi:hypothetical protein